MADLSNILLPDYENCLANLPNSILKKFGAEPVGKTLPLLDEYLKKDYKNVILLLLDGMGVKVLENHLEPEGIFRSHMTDQIKTVFLATTVAATTSAITGLQSCEHGWLAWDTYYPEIDKTVTVFWNKEAGTEKEAADYQVGSTLHPYESVVEKIRKAGGYAYEASPFMEPKTLTVTDLFDRLKMLCDLPQKKYIYAYWTEPDNLLHEYGSGSVQVTEVLKDLEKRVSEFCSQMEDTLVIVTADHGHINIDSVYLKDYEELCDCLIRMPAFEARVLNLFVKEEKKEFFEQEFNRLFGEKFLLMPMEEVLEKKLLGTAEPFEGFRAMLGNYLAIATDTLAIHAYGEDDREDVLVSAHGSLTKDEMLIPLILFEK